MENRASLSLAVGLAGLLLGLAAAAQAQYLVVGVDNKLYWDDTGKTVFTGKAELVMNGMPVGELNLNLRRA